MTSPSSPTLPHRSTPSQRLINEAQTIVYRRWIKFGASHDAALDHAAMFALRMESLAAKSPGKPAAISMESLDFDLWVSRSEKAAAEATRKSSEAFAAALDRQVRRGRETAARGTFVDRSPAVCAVRIRGEVPMSALGSPAAMCVEK